MSQALSLGSALGVPVATGTTCGLNNGVTPSCTFSNASDMSYQWTAPSDGTYTFTTTGSNFDTVLVLAPYTTPTVQTCVNAVSGTGAESLTITALSGSQYLVTIDGYASLCGSYQLNITKACVSACDTPPGPCYGAAGTCSAAGTCLYPPLASGSACNDGNACTTGDVCDGAGTCSGTPIACNSPPGECYISTGTCSNGTCSYGYKFLGSTCSIGHCDGAGTCLICVPGSTQSCQYLASPCSSCPSNALPAVSEADSVLPSSDDPNICAGCCWCVGVQTCSSSHTWSTCRPGPGVAP